MSKRCFVIAPIGEPGSEIREHSDEVFKFVIEPAMEACDFEAMRADHLNQPGKITDQMFDRILNDDLCIAVVTGHNPNVFYEIAIAQAAGRPVILLLEQGEVMPFDLKDQRYVEYRMMPTPFAEKVYAKQVIEHIRYFESVGWQAPSVFPVDFLPSKANRLLFRDQAHHFGASDVWMRMLDEADETFDIMGITLASWKRTDGFADAIAAKAATGCKIRILLMHPDNPALPELINDSVEEDRLGEVTASLVKAHAFYAKLAKANANVGVGQITRGCAHFQLARSDTRATYIPYLFSRKTDLSPLLETNADHPFYEAIVGEFDNLWLSNVG